ncbi:hypothetical protein NYZ99_19085 [Maribacter litopenaei]|uniref:Uncharacterized protein n=1 Tax=Maribacter litopenaei TaxID=2976127 RepID=A0ABY5Y735_9FLAO|nr:hypothetical protein [Maribacter litopenaei]UWX54836.1 hypothetical protein NYZ99_19085 [Maribacter litopenaei]
MFISKHKKSWPFLKSNPLKGISDNYREKKNIRVVGIPKSIAQTKYVGDLINQIQETNPKQLEGTAVILGDESLLNPLLNSIPKTIASVNITMGQKLDLTGLATFFSNFIDLHLAVTRKGWFYTDFTAFINNPYSIALLGISDIKAEKLISHIHQKNWIYISNRELRQYSDSNPRGF